MVPFSKHGAGYIYSMTLTNFVRFLTYLCYAYIDIARFPAIA